MQLWVAQCINPLHLVVGFVDKEWLLIQVNGLELDGRHFQVVRCAALHAKEHAWT